MRPFQNTSFHAWSIIYAVRFSNETLPVDLGRSFLEGLLESLLLILYLRDFPPCKTLRKLEKHVQRYQLDFRSNNRHFINKHLLFVRVRTGRVLVPIMHSWAVGTALPRGQMRARTLLAWPIFSYLEHSKLVTGVTDQAWRCCLLA